MVPFATISFPPNAEAMRVKERAYLASLRTIYLLEIEMRIDTIAIEHRMTERHLNRNQVANRIGCTWPNTNKLINGNTSRINFDILGRLCTALDLTPSEIFTTEEEVAQEQAETRRCSTDWPRSPERESKRVLRDS